MKKFFRGIVAVVACFGLFLMVACSNVSKSYAEKINKAAKDGEPITLEQVRKDLGDDCAEVGDFLITKSGMIISVKGCKSLDDVKAKVNNGEDVEGIIITIVLGKATSAEYRKIQTSDLK
ncbi:MAG: hypothetical protein K2O22_03750 [Anaeroplasmataceae bacterium]|nr:hypothetical protein [Anaeroplasmataceae bacterium]